MLSKVVSKSLANITVLFLFCSQYTYNKDNADWSREMRGQQLLNPAHLNNWVMIFAAKDQNNANDLYATLQKVCPPMGMRINKPKL